MSDTCTHLDQAGDVEPGTTGCEDCLRMGGRWVHLRMCMSCGHVGCCDSSPNRHATAHFHESAHPLVQSYEPGQEPPWSLPPNVGIHGSPASAACSIPMKIVFSTLRTHDSVERVDSRTSASGLASLSSRQKAAPGKSTMATKSPSRASQSAGS